MYTANLSYFQHYYEIINFHHDPIILVNVNLNSTNLNEVSKEINDASHSLLNINCMFYGRYGTKVKTPLLR
jgi:hypothetical protein